MVPPQCGVPVHVLLNQQGDFFLNVNLGAPSPNFLLNCPGIGPGIAISLGNGGLQHSMDSTDSEGALASSAPPWLYNTLEHQTLTCTQGFASASRVTM